MADKIQFRRDTASRWASVNPILLSGEIGLVTDSENKYKLGDGVHTWNELPLQGFNGTLVDIPGTDTDSAMSQKGATDLVSEYNVSANNNNAEYTFAQAVALVPVSLQKGGLTIKYIDSTTHEYVVKRLMSSTWSIIESNWKEIDNELDFLIVGTNITNLNLTKTLNKFISALNGQVKDINNFAYTEKFYATKGTVIAVRARGYLTSVAMISKVITEDSLYEVLVPSIDNVLNNYFYLVEEDGYYAVSFQYNYECRIAIIANAPLSLLEKINKNTDDISDIQGDISDRTQGVSIVNPTVTLTTSHFINAYNGSVVELVNYAYTSKFYATKGSKIVVNARGYLTAVAMISKVITEDSLYEVLVASDGSTVHDYTYIVQEDSYYAVSYNTNAACTIKIITNTPELLLNLIDKNKNDISNLQPLLSIKPYVQTIDSNVFYPNINETSLTIAESNKFINANNGEIASSNNFAYSTSVTLQRGQTIVFRGKGYYTSVALISKVITVGVKYKPIIIGDNDNVVKDWVYIVEEDGDYAFSFSSSNPYKLFVIENKIFKQIVSYIPDIPTPEPVVYDELVNIKDMLFSGVPKIGMIGDSLMSGCWYDPYTTTHLADHPEYSWYKVLERDGGNTYIKLCAGGMSAHAFARNSHSSGIGLNTALQTTNKCQLYIIGLEINDRNVYPNDLGTSSDIDLTNPENNAQSFYGDYAYIIQKITEFNSYAKFIVFTNPRGDSNWNDAIRYISTIFNNVYLCDLFAKYNNLFGAGGYYDDFKDTSNHYPAMAYASMGKLLEKAISETIKINLTDFKYIQGE